MPYDVDITLNTGSSRGPFDIYYCSGSTESCGATPVESGITRPYSIIVIHLLDVPDIVNIIKVVDTGGICPDPNLFLPVEGVPETYRILQQNLYKIETENGDYLNQEH